MAALIDVILVSTLATSVYPSDCGFRDDDAPCWFSDGGLGLGLFAGSRIVVLPFERVASQPPKRAAARISSKMRPTLISLPVAF